MNGFAAVGRELQATGLVSDPWLDGAPRFAAPVVLPASRWREVAAAAAGIARVHDELTQIVAAAPELVDAFFGLTPWQRGMWQCAAPDWHGIARADVFWTTHGAKVCELNSDTPSGAAEAVLCNRLATDAGSRRHDPNAMLQRRFLAMVEARARCCGHAGPLTVGILYPTEMPEDLSMIAIYRQWLETAGHAVVLGSPFNLGLAADGRATLFDVACDAMVRHYKTDWFGERLPVADDDPPAEDRAPLAGPLLHLLHAAVERRTAICNPFGAVLTQNKRALAFCWEEQARFSAAAREAITRWLPRTHRLEHVREDLWHDKDRWVLKSDYGCEGDEVVIGRHVDQAAWDAALTHVIARRWVAQQYFEPLPEPDGNVHNHGVYVIGGAPAGLLLRVHAATVSTDTSACIAAVHVDEEPADG